MVRIVARSLIASLTNRHNQGNEIRKKNYGMLQTQN